MPNRIYELRKKFGLKQSDLADKLGISQQTLSRIENEITHPAIDVLCALADYFDVSIDYLVCRNELQQIITLEDPVMETLIENYDFLKMIGKLNEKEKQAILQIIEVFACESL